MWRGLENRGHGCDVDMPRLYFKLWPGKEASISLQLAGSSSHYEW